MKKKKMIRSGLGLILAAGLVFVFAIITPSRARAAEPLPGDACATSGETVYTGGPGEAGHFLVCNGSNYVSFWNLDNSGQSLFQVGIDAGSCTPAIQGRLRYHNNILQMCTGSCWITWGQIYCDIEPDAFTFTDQTNADLSTPATSNVVQITGMTASAPISISGSGASPEYRICSDVTCSSVVQSWGTANSTVSVGQYVQLRTTSAGTFDTAVTATLTAGLTSDTWSVTTRNDNIPNSFNFNDVSGTNISTLTTHNPGIQITGITGSVPISISGAGGQYRVCADAACVANPAWTSGAGTINNNQYVQVRVTSSGSYDTMVSTTVTVGTGSDTWNVTTKNDDVPNGFNFTDVTGAAMNSLITHAPGLQITGITGSVATSITGSGAEYRICNDSGCGAVTTNWTTGASTMTNGQYVQLRLTSSPSYNTQFSTTFTVGAGSDIWYVTTPDNVPDAFNFNDATGVNISTQTTHAPGLQITGITGNIPTSISGGGAEYRICNDSGCGVVTTNWTTGASTMTNGQYVQLRITSSGSYATGVSTSFTVGTGSDTWNVTTLNPDTCPSISLSNQSGQPINTWVQSNYAQITSMTNCEGTGTPGATPTASTQWRTCTGPGTGCGAWSSSNGGHCPGDYLQIQIFPTAYSTSYSIGMPVGSCGTGYTVTTQAAPAANCNWGGTVAHGAYADAWCASRQFIDETPGDTSIEYGGDYYDCGIFYYGHNRACDHLAGHRRYCAGADNTGWGNSPLIGNGSLEGTYPYRYAVGADWAVCHVVSNDGPHSLQCNNGSMDGAPYYCNGGWAPAPATD